MKCFLLVIALCVCAVSQAQYTVTGQLETATEDCVSDVVIKLFQGNQFIQQTFSDKQGIFSLQDVSQGSYTLEIISVLYEKYVQPIQVDQDIVLPTILLKEESFQLDELVIGAKQKPIVQTDEGILLQVAKTRLQNQPDVISILNFAPTISTLDGIRILGSDDIVIQVDGKEIRIEKSRISTFLETLNPQTIDEIEIVDRVDGSMEGDKRGVIKITTIKNEGWVGTIRQNGLYNEKWGYSSDASLFYQRKKIRAFGNYYHARHKTQANGKGVLNEKIKELHYTNVEKSKVNRKSDYVTLGVDYQFNQDNSLSFLYLFEDDQDDNHQRTVLSTVSSLNLLSDSLIQSQTFFDQVNKMHSYSLSFTSDLDTLGSKFTIVFDFAAKKYFNPFVQQNEYQNALSIIREENSQNARAKNDIYVLNTQWEKKYSNQKTWSIGSRISWVNNKDYFRFLDLTKENGVSLDNFSNDFFLKEYIFSAFTNVVLPLTQKSTFTVGIRTEYNYNDFASTTSTGNNNNFKVLPNVLFSTKLDDQPFYISVMQRLMRPNYSLFNTTYVKDSPISAYSGNDKLKPADIYSLQMGYRLKNNISLDWRYNHAKNNSISLPQHVNGIVVISPINAGYRNDFFAFVSWSYSIATWWEAYTKATGAYLDFKLRNQKFSSLYANFSLNNTFYLFDEMEINLNYSYISDYRVLYTKVKQVNTVNCTVFYPLSSSFSLTVGVNDVFDSVRTRHEYDVNNLYSYTDQRYNSRSCFLSIKYNFSKGKEVDDEIRDMEIEAEKSRY